MATRLSIFLVVATLCVSCIPTSVCEKNAFIPLGDMELVNNAHGSAHVEEGARYDQCIAVDESGASSWRWACSSSNMHVKGFPNLTFGTNPWTRRTTTRLLPRRAGEIDALDADFSARVDANGLWNLAFDLWFMRDSTVSPDNIAVEVMVWLDATMQVTIPPEAGIEIEGIPYLLFEGWHPDGHMLHILRAKKPVREGSVPLGTVIHFLLDSGRLGEDAYLSTIELGTEIVSGAGTVTIERFSVSPRFVRVLDG
jgi:hypothetical protein